MAMSSKEISSELAAMKKELEEISDPKEREKMMEKINKKNQEEKERNQRAIARNREKLERYVDILIRFILHPMQPISLLMHHFRDRKNLESTASQLSDKLDDERRLKESSENQKSKAEKVHSS